MKSHGHTRGKTDNAVEAEVREPENSLPPVTLQELPEPLQKACAAAGWSSLTPVQSLAIPYLLAGRDIMVQSRTGSGKTGCYLLPLIESLDSKLHKPQALVLVPTRELALQVERESTTLFSGTGLRSCAIYGGTGYRKQLEALQKGVQLIIGTPGRVLDHLRRRTLVLDALRNLIFDEADRMLSIGFYPDMQEVAGYLPDERQTTMFSATYPPHVLKLANEFMHNPEMLSLSQKEVHVAEVEHLYCPVKPMDRDRALVRLLETENPSSAIIFCNTKADVHYLASVLKGFGYRADELSADLPQQKREAVLARLRDGKTKYLVATDVAARGIDIPNLSHVFMYDPPDDQESYIHRAGRTGRAGAAGTVISLVDVMQKPKLDRIGRNYRIQMREIPLPTDEQVADTVCDRLNTILESRLRNLTGLEKIRVDRYIPLAKQIASPEMQEDDQALQIMALLLDDYHRQSLNENRFPVTIPPRPQPRQINRKKRPGTGRRPQKRGQ